MSHPFFHPTDYHLRCDLLVWRACAFFAEMWTRTQTAIKPLHHSWAAMAWGSDRTLRSWRRVALIIMPMIVVIMVVIVAIVIVVVVVVVAVVVVIDDGRGQCRCRRYGAGRDWLFRATTVG